MKMRTKQVLAVVVIFLFLSVTTAPSLQADTQPILEGEMVEFTTEIYGLPGKEPQTVQLTQREAEAVDKLFEDIRTQLENVETREEAVEIFNEAIVELDRYGLLPKKFRQKTPVVPHECRAS